MNPYADANIGIHEDVDGQDVAVDVVAAGSPWRARLTNANATSHARPVYLTPATARAIAADLIAAADEADTRNLADGMTEDDDPPEDDYDPGPEVDDEGGMSEHRYMAEPEWPPADAYLSGEHYRGP